jgi:L,D-transpeptidase ErfK/SrfK
VHSVELAIYALPFVPFLILSIAQKSALMSNFHSHMSSDVRHIAKNFPKKTKNLVMLCPLKRLSFGLALSLSFVVHVPVALANNPTLSTAEPNSSSVSTPEAPIAPVTSPTPIPLTNPSVMTFPGNVIELPNLQNVDQFLPPVEEEVRLIIRLKKRRVYLYRGEELHASFPIAVGKQGWETPKGNFKVLDMKKNPSWQNPFNGEVIPPGSDNPLGSRWIGFWTNGKNYIGFHGTPNEGSVGRAASHGCIRMFDKDVQKIFELVKVGTPVAVTD